MKVTEILVESRMGELHSEFADVYHRLAPKIQRHKDAAGAEQLYQALKAVAVENNAVAIFKNMLNAARNAAHMDYDTNPGGFENWFWYLPFDDDDLSEGSSDIRKKISKFEELALAANRAGDDEKCKFYQQKIQTLKQKMSQGVTEAKFTSQFKTKQEAVQYAKEKVKIFRDPEDGIEVWAMPDSGFNVVHTMNYSGRESVMALGGRKLGTVGPRQMGVTESKIIKMKVTEIAQPRHKILTESCQGLTVQQRRIVEGIYNEFRPVLEVALNPQQINQLFTATQQAATDAGGNRTLVGKGMDAAGAVNRAIDNVGKWLQNTAPVQAFDQKFENLKGNIAQKFPQLGRSVSQLGEWAKANPGKTAAIVGVLTTIAALGAGPAGGAIAGQILRGTAELLKGEKLSTAVGKGVKTAALGYLSGKAFEMLGQFVSGMRADSIPFGPKDAGLEDVSFHATKTLTGPGSEWKQTLKGFNVIVFPEEKSAIEEALRMIRDGQAGGYDTLRTISREINSADYRSAILDIARNARADQIANDGLTQWINGLAQAGQSLSQGAAAGSGVASRPQTTAESITPQQIQEMFQRVEEGVWDYLKGKASQAGQAIAGKVAQVGQNITTKITADKLSTAWKAAGSPTDSDQIFALLVKQGVDKNVLAGVWKQMQLPAPRTAPAPTAQRTTAPPQAGTAPAQVASKSAALPQAGMDSSRFGSMVKNLTGPNTASSTGGTTQRTATGVRHTANPNNPNLRATQQQLQSVTEASGPTEQEMDQSISDLIKDALGTRPTSDWMQRWMAMSADKKLALYQQLASQLD